MQKFGEGSHGRIYTDIRLILHPNLLFGIKSFSLLSTETLHQKNQNMHSSERDITQVIQSRLMFLGIPSLSHKPNPTNSLLPTLEGSSFFTHWLLPLIFPHRLMKSAMAAIHRSSTKTTMHNSSGFTIGSLAAPTPGETEQTVISQLD